MGARASVVGVALAAALACTPLAAAKDFRPGDLRLCGAHRCVAINDQALLDGLSGFYYGSTRLSRSSVPAMKTPYYELRFRNGYVTGIVATAGMGRFLSYGVNTGRFTRGIWYRVPVRVRAALRTTGASLLPRRLSAAALGKSR